VVGWSLYFYKFMTFLPLLTPLSPSPVTLSTTLDLTKMAVNVIDVDLEISDTFLRRGFSVAAMSSNKKLHRLAVLRKSDYSQELLSSLISDYTAPNA